MPLRLLVRMPVLPLDQLQLVLVLLLGWLLRLLVRMPLLPTPAAVLATMVTGHCPVMDQWMLLVLWLAYLLVAAVAVEVAAVLSLPPPLRAAVPAAAVRPHCMCTAAILCILCKRMLCTPGIHSIGMTGRRIDRTGDPSKPCNSA